MAVVVPNQSALEEWARTNGVQESYTQLCQNAEANLFVLSALNATGKLKKVRRPQVYVCYIRQGYGRYISYRAHSHHRTPSLAVKFKISALKSVDLPAQE